MKILLLSIIIQIVFAGIAGGSATKDLAVIRGIKFLANSGEIRVVVNIDGKLKTLPTIEVLDENRLDIDIEGSYSESSKRNFSMDDPYLEKVDLYRLDDKKVRIRISLSEPYKVGAGRVLKMEGGFIIALKRNANPLASVFTESGIDVEKSDVEQSFPTIFTNELKAATPEESIFSSKKESGSNQVIRMISSLALVIGIFLIGAWLIKKRFLGRGATGNGSLIKVLDRSYIDVKKGIAIVDVAGEILVVGFFDGGITMLTKLEGEEAISRVKKRQQNGDHVKFADIVKKATIDLKISDDPDEGTPGTAASAMAGIQSNRLMDKIRKLRPIK